MALMIYAVAMLVVWLGASLYLILGSRKIPDLKSIPPLDGTDLPSVAVVIAVRNEEDEVEEALQSVCRLDYPNLEIYVINDRSTDGTPQILERMASQLKRFHLITIEELPEGWLGKNHALYKGALTSEGEWLLFTDADVKFKTQALRKAMSYVQQHRFDHLAVLPEITARSWLFAAVVNTFALMLTMKLRPWNAPDQNSRASVGVGAFNLVRRTAYEKVGTHREISLRPDDDLKLGEHLKMAGFHQGVLYGEEEIWLQWYTGLKQFVQGLMKNTFSVANYNFLLALGMALSTFLLLVLPVPLLLVCGFPYTLMAGLILLSQVLVMVLAKGIQARWWFALLIPFSGLVMVYIILKSAWLTIRQGGIYWRDHFYSLAELKKQA